MTLGIARRISPPVEPLLTEVRVRRLYALAAVLAIGAALALAVDLPLSRLFQALQHNGPGDLRKAVNLFEAFAHGLGVAVILIAVAVLDPAHRRSVPQLAACAYGAGVVNLVAKMIVGRSRPLTYWEHELPMHVQDTFVGWVPRLLGPEGIALGHGIESFPSGHSATAAGLAVGLAWLYPQGRWLFAGLTVLAMLQRVQSGAHFPSDTLAGAAVVVLVASICCDPRLLGRWFPAVAREHLLACSVAQGSID
jgi:membrane-associated phospholipid phosphatase